MPSGAPSSTPATCSPGKSVAHERPWMLEEYMQSVEELKDFDFDKYVEDMALSHKAVKPKLPST
ncbi:hypothetical protein ACHFCA_14415 [Delftia tsuruhatensis]